MCIYLFTVDIYKTCLSSETVQDRTKVTSLLPRDASAECGDATVSRLSVCPSVCDDHIS